MTSETKPKDSTGFARTSRTTVPDQGAASVSKLPLFGDDMSDAEALAAVIRRLSCAERLPEVMEVTAAAARRMIGADGVTFVLREGDSCHYAEEDAIGPLWKGQRFPASACISGWVMEHARAVAIPDIREDARIPQDAYAPTFVRSLAMVPVRQERPVAALGAYWADLHAASAEELDRLQTLANAASLALALVQCARSDKAVREQAALLDALLAYLPEGITIARAPDVVIERVSEFGLRRIGRSSGEVTGLAAEQHPDAWQIYDRSGRRLLSADELPLTRATRHGEVIENERVTVKLANGEMLPILCNAGPILDEQGEITGGIIAWRDVASLAEAEDARALLVRELDHRVKNTFELLLSLVDLTARGAAGVGEMASSLKGRILALARAHQLAGAGGDETGGSLAAMLGPLLRPHVTDPGQLRVDGPEVSLGSKAAAQLALAMHELATNAEKYGALSAPEGRLQVEWRCDDSELTIEWIESDGPAVTGKPESEGFGTRLVQATIERQLEGTIVRRWQDSGLEVEIAIPRRRLGD